MTVAAWEMLKMHSMEGKALRQASDASDVMFSLELSHNVHSKDTLSRHPSETVEVLQGAPSSDVADLQRLRRLARPPNDFEMQLLEVVRRVRAPFVDSERGCSAAHLAMQLRKRGYITQLRNAKPRECGKACGRTCLEKLQHTYILVTGSLDSAVTMPIVVEQNFREHFSIASSTPAYRRLLAAAPGEFAGSVSRLAAIVELLSDSVKRAFAEQGLPLPPWRRAKSVMSKWGMGPNAHASEDEAVPFSSGSKRPAVGGNSPPPPPPPRGASAAQRERKPPRSGSRERSAGTGRSTSLQLRTSEGLEGLLEQVGASMAPGRQQALQVSRDHAKHSTERGPGGASVRVDIAADASRDAAHHRSRAGQADKERRAAARPVTNLRGGSSGSGDPQQANARSGHPLRGGPGKSTQTEQDPSCPSSAPAKGHKVVSLLAQGLADQAAATQHPPALRTEAPPKQAADKAQQQAPWFLNLPHINTVRRIGKAGNDGKP